MNKQAKTSDDELTKLEYRVIVNMIPDASSVLDLGCGDGKLLYLLVQNRHVKGRGVEVDEDAIYECVSRGLSVSHQDIDGGLSEYGDNSFDYVILNQTLQQVKNLERVLEEAVRVGRKVIIGFPNFAYFSSRLQMIFKGKAPVTLSLPYMWYDTPNLHFLSINDFYYYCHKKKLKIEKSVFLDNNRIVKLFPNFFAEVGIFVISAELT